MEITIDLRNWKGAVQYEKEKFDFEMLWLYRPKHDTNNIKRINFRTMYIILINFVFWNSRLFAGDLLNGTTRIH